MLWQLYFDVNYHYNKLATSLLGFGNTQRYFNAKYVMLLPVLNRILNLLTDPPSSSSVIVTESLLSYMHAIASSSVNSLAHTLTVSHHIYVICSQ